MQTNPNEAHCSRVVRLLPASERSDILSAVISAAALDALDPACPHSIWAAMVRMAEAKDKPAPLIGFSPDGIQYAGHQYQAEGIPDILTFKNFADRMRRKRKLISLATLANTR